MHHANLLILIAVLLPPKALDLLGEVVAERTYLTPYGEAGPLALRAVTDDLAVWVQPYTGLPTRTDPRATLFAARQLGVQRILNWDMGIALNPVLQRGQPALATDYISWVHHQADSFFGAAHTGLDVDAASTHAAFCPHLNAELSELLPGIPAVTVLGADFLRRETPAEARMFRQFGADALSYNLVPEVALAHELGLCYAGLLTISAMGANYPQPEPHGEVRASLNATMQILPELVRRAAAARTCRCAG